MSPGGSNMPVLAGNHNSRVTVTPHGANKKSSAHGDNIQPQADTKRDCEKKYVYAPGAPFPKRWRTAQGRAFRIMGEPVEGYVLARFPGCLPFAISVKNLMNGARPRHRLGPFECLDGDRSASNAD